jgi:hypothetical protein
MIFQIFSENKLKRQNRYHCSKPAVTVAKTAVKIGPKGKIDGFDNSEGKLDRFIVPRIMCSRVHSLEPI